MFKLLYFLIGWFVGIFVLNQFVFTLFFKFITDENAIAILGVILVAFYTMVWGVVVIKINSKK